MSATAVILSLTLLLNPGAGDPQEPGNSRVQKQDEPIVSKSKAEVGGGTIGAVAVWFLGKSIVTPSLHSFTLFSNMVVGDPQGPGNSSVQKQDEPIMSEGAIIGAAIGGTFGWVADMAIGIAAHGNWMNAAPVFSSLGALAGAWLGSKIQHWFLR